MPKPILRINPGGDTTEYEGPNPVSSIVANLDQVIHVANVGDTHTYGSFPGIPIIATIKYIESEVDDFIGYSITFDIEQMTLDAAKSMNVETTDIEVSYKDGVLTLADRGGES